MDMVLSFNRAYYIRANALQFKFDSLIATTQQPTQTDIVSLISLLISIIFIV